MSETYNRMMNRRLMNIPASAGTFYPTGVVLGVKDAAGNVNGSSATASGTAANSWYLQAVANQPRTALDTKYGAVIVSVNILTGAAGTLVFESHAGTALTPAFDTTARGFFAFDDGFHLLGGWRVTVTGTANISIEWEMIER